MRNKKILQKTTCIALITAMMCAAMGCGTVSAKDDSSSEIALIEPVNAISNTEAAAYRDLYDASIYSAYVLPYSEEYQFDQDIYFDQYLALPGDSVSNGTAIMQSNTESLEKELESLQDSLEAMEDDHFEYVEEMEEKIKTTNRQASDMADFIKDSPQLRSMAFDIYTWRDELKQANELYELDHDYKLKQIENCKKKKNSTVVSRMNGAVVDITKLTKGGQVSKDASVVAIGDMNHKLLRTDYINSSTIQKADDVYAIIDGKRYDLAYQTMDPDEYTKLTSKGETVYSTFEFTQETPEISMGDFATLVVVGDYRQKALSIPNSSLHKDETGTYVYLLQDKEPVYTLIHTGMSDGVYTEVLDGISDGDLVLTDDAPKYSTQTAKVTKGDFSTKFESKGEAFYPSQISVVNDIPYGSVYFVSYQVDTFQHVEEGDVIATVRVEKDSFEVERIDKQIARLRERLADYLRGNENPSEHTKARYQRQIDKLNEKKAKMEAAYATTEIRATKSGIITTEFNYKEEDIISKEQQVAIVADESSCYIRVENTNELLNLGNEVEITFNDQENGKHATTGTVVTLANRGTDSALADDHVLIQVPTEAVSEMTSALVIPAGFEADFESEWFDEWRKIFTIKADVRKMEQVLIVPKNAVFESSGRTYVYVKKQDGTIVAQSFIAGGYDTNNYWIVDGLEEGCEVCLK